MHVVSLEFSFRGLRPHPSISLARAFDIVVMCVCAVLCLSIPCRRPAGFSSLRPAYRPGFVGNTWSLRRPRSFNFRNFAPDVEAPRPSWGPSPHKSRPPAGRRPENPAGRRREIDRREGTLAHITIRHGNLLWPNIAVPLLDPWLLFGRRFLLIKNALIWTP